jgi:pimeloyl-ACP methyl ester carboxylesterase
VAELDANGVTLHVQRLGTAPPTVLFLHGLVMDNLSSFYFTLANPVAQIAQAVLVDLRGHGRSQRPPTGYGLRDLQADLAALITALEVRGPLHLVGNSFGGLLALALAADAPGRFASLVLLDAHLGRRGWGDAMADTLSLKGEARDQAIAEGFAHWLGRNSQRKSSRLAATATALVEHTSLLSDLRSSPPLEEAQLRQITCPVLALYGEQSDLRAEARALPGILPQVRLELRADCTHSILWEQTEWVKEQLLAWLREHP